MKVKKGKKGKNGKKGKKGKKISKSAVEIRQIIPQEMTIDNV